MSCVQRESIARELLALGLITVKSDFGKTMFYAITDQGMKLA